MLDKSQLSAPLSKSSTLSAAEVAKFDAMAREWWDPQGKFKTALEFNRARLEWFVAQIQAHFSCDPKHSDSLNGLNILDVGCGGGLVSEALAKLGANVTGIDASAVSIEVARSHARQSEITIDYRHQLSSDLVAQNAQFDVVINAEVVEHVPDQKQLISECCQLVKPGGLLILATLNRTIKSFVIAILGAEYVMRYLPRGTHDWRWFVKPKELREMTVSAGLQLTAQTGMSYRLLAKQWVESNSLAVNYAQAYGKPER
ncbi:bifunctional 2-polyprenyl-6-hydroxyphenol methylase/3-demethylubiquinol 3-O-methyltransferase UbiG [Alteromonas flava]|uniref:bifunctional 2-polyprenyl-6-hydroxyphenol methylase/3-demethylubiquinol 3-O-methyltransferase UbiG n=1 Tax=Alteromonas flava TaxID=2048003 RepID=UPI000C2856DF|nr:bifunctional 2-polyprenyl-6-hydroxyphenol methylase/3-demethylubiquinol 3-O-methyltransferase UbiG [Alteromonas flava]